MDRCKLSEKYREWALSFELAHYGTEDERILSFINSLWRYADFLEIPKDGAVYSYSDYLSAHPHEGVSGR